MGINPLWRPFFVCSVQVLTRSKHKTYYVMQIELPLDELNQGIFSGLGDLGDLFGGKDSLFADDEENPFAMNLSRVSSPIPFSAPMPLFGALVLSVA